VQRRSGGTGGGIGQKKRRGAQRVLDALQAEGELSQARDGGAGRGGGARHHVGALHSLHPLVYTLQSTYVILRSRALLGWRPQGRWEEEVGSAQWITV
jgi:hypothetical protein